MNFKTTALAAGAIAFSMLTATAANAVITLENVTAVNDDHRYDYRATLAPDEGLRAGDQLVVYDFGGYVEGSVFAAENWIASVEFLSNQPEFVTVPDSAATVNLVFTYTGPDFRIAGGPFETLAFNGFGALSTMSNTVAGFFTTQTRKNNPELLEGTVIGQGGSVLIPGGVVPEPATWGMLILGFGLVGASARRRSRMMVSN